MLNINRTITDYIVLITVLSNVTHVAAIKSYEKEDELRKKLMTGYQQNARPDMPTVLTSFYSLMTLKSLDIAEEKMGTVGWLTLVWEDPRLTWNSDSFMGIKTLEMTTIWRPNFFIANEIKKSSTFGFTTTDPVRVYNNGTVRWLVPLNIETECDVDIALFPFDSQKCSIYFIYWITSKDETMVELRGKEVHMEFYSSHGEWELTDSSDELEDFEICCPRETVQRNIIKLQFKRRRTYYVVNVLLPTALLSVCVVWTFLLPTESGERIGYSLTILLSFTVFLTITNDLLPPSCKQIPVFATYLLIVLILSLLSVSLTVWNVKFHKLEGDPPRMFAKICFCGRKPEEITWKHLSETLDRIYFYLFLASVVILNAALFITLMSDEHRAL